MMSSSRKDYAIKLPIALSSIFTDGGYYVVMTVQKIPSLQKTRHKEVSRQIGESMFQSIE